MWKHVYVALSITFPSLLLAAMMLHKDKMGKFHPSTHYLSSTGASTAKTRWLFVSGIAGSFLTFSIGAMLLMNERGAPAPYFVIPIISGAAMLIGSYAPLDTHSMLHGLAIMLGFLWSSVAFLYTCMCRKVLVEVILALVAIACVCLYVTFESSQETHAWAGIDPQIMYGEAVQKPAILILYICSFYTFYLVVQSPGIPWGSIN